VTSVHKRNTQDSHSDNGPSPKNSASGDVMLITNILRIRSSGSRGDFHQQSAVPRTGLTSRLADWLWKYQDISWGTNLKFKTAWTGLDTEEDSAV
jgi:hypothetical protein